jgi:signal transduction histidine kinase
MERAPRIVFVSHTSELREFPKAGSFISAVESAIARRGDVAIDMEYFTASELPPSNLCRRRVQESDLYVAVVGFRHGSPVRDDPGRSYTEIEFEAAGEIGLPRFVFLLDEEAEIALPVKFLSDPDPKLQARQQAFRARLLESDLTVSFVESPQQLETLALQALMESEARLSRPTETLRLMAHELRRLLSGSVGVDDGDRVATYFAEIAETLEEVARRVAAGEPGGSTCREIAVYAAELQGVIGDDELFRSTHDASVAETRERLQGMLDSTEQLWWGSERQFRAASQLRLVAIGEARLPDEHAVQAIEDELQRADDAKSVWDAAGEFRALARTIRARGRR